MKKSIIGDKLLKQFATTKPSIPDCDSILWQNFYNILTKINLMCLSRANDEVTRGLCILVQSVYSLYLTIALAPK